MGLRIKDGINMDNFYEACGLNLFGFFSLEKIDYLKKLELLVGDDDGIRLTDKGFGVMDKVILDLCS
jgi:coproporphyrinogen III oxidase-like Fe-S oxidoreductase